MASACWEMSGTRELARLVVVLLLLLSLLLEISDTHALPIQLLGPRS